MRLFLTVAAACVGVSDCRVSHLLLVAGFVVLLVPWINCLRILDKLKGEGYTYSDMFGPSLFLRYWQVAPERSCPGARLVSPSDFHASILGCSRWSAVCTEHNQVANHPYLVPG